MPVHCPCDAQVGHIAFVSVPAAAGVAMIGADMGGVATAALAAHDGLQLRAQFSTIHACAAPVHWPCADHVGHVACESVPEQDTVAGRGAAVAAMKTGAAVGAAAAAEQQLRAQFDSIHAREELAHSPCDAQAAHEACKTRTNQ